MHFQIKALVVAVTYAWTGSVFALGLAETIIEAEKNDSVLASAMANRDAAAENIPMARSRLLPQLAVQGSYAKTNQNITQPDAYGQSVTRDIRTSSTNTALSLRQGLFRPKDWAGYTVGELQAEYGLQKLLSAQSDLWSRAIGAWVDVLAAIENRRAQAEAVESTKYAAQQAAKRRTAGDGTKDGELEAYAQHELAKAQLVEAEQTLIARKTAYRLLTGQEGQFNGHHLPHYSRVKLTLNNQGAATQRALDINPDVLSARAAEGVNEYRLKQAKWDHYPTVDAFASYTRANSDTVNTLGMRYNTSQVGVQLAIPLYTGGGLDATERQVAYVYAASVSDRKASEARLETQFASDWAAQQALYDRAQSAEVLVKAAREQRRSAEMFLKAGVKTWADVATADMLIARRETDFIYYTANLIKTQAKVLSVYPISIDEWPQWTKSVGYAAKK